MLYGCVVPRGSQVMLWLGSKVATQGGSLGGAPSQAKFSHSLCPSQGHLDEQQINP